MRGGAWLALAAVAWCARAGPGPPPAPTLWHFPYQLYNLSIPENSPPRSAARVLTDETPLAITLPAPGAKVKFKIRHGDKDKFFKAEERCVGDRCFATIRTRAGHADVLNRERKDKYRLDLRASASLPNGARLDADTAIEIFVDDVNDLSPLFYPTDYDVLVPEDTPPHASVARVSAEDADLGLNGEIYYSFAENTDQFAVHTTSGVVTLTRSLDYNERSKHELTVLAHDRASLLARGESAPAAKARLTVKVTKANLHAPELHARHLPELQNVTGEVYAIVEVIDRDEGEHGRISSVEIVDGDPDGHFRVVPSSGLPDSWDIIVHTLLDQTRELRYYNLTIKATDAGLPQRSSYLALPVTLSPRRHHKPVFSRKVYETSVSENSPPRTPLVRLKVSEKDRDDSRVYIEIVGGNEGGEFIVNPETGVLYTAIRLDAEQKSLYTLTVSAVDHGDSGTREQSSAKVKITVLDANDNDPVFDRKEMIVTIPENGASGAVVTKVSARDADSGENAYISYSIANLQPVPFEVDHFSGAIRTTRLLDYESMRREYLVRVRASDWGLPYRRQAELKLTIRLQDVNDNRPQFEKVDCIGHVPRRTPPGTEITTLSAIDFDAGDVVSYRIISGNDDHCFGLDSSTGVLSLTCDLRDLRSDVRLLNVTATDGTHFADAVTLTMHLGGGGTGQGVECRDAGVAKRLTELLAAAERSNAPSDTTDEFPSAPSRYGENLHSPEFIEFPVEVKVNESIALGTRLVTLHARDRDLGYNGLLVYAISGGDDDSAFRIDPETGELSVIGYLDRERESEYYLNITVWDLGQPARTASRLLPITVLDVNDNSPIFDKTLASYRVTENALNGTAVFTAHATDRDDGNFAKITYSVQGAGEGEFCVDRVSGTLYVCAPLDREQRALYELTVLATDGGGRQGEALVRIAVDDINDNPPKFELPGYGARVREDVPRGTVVAVLNAPDPDLGAGGVVTYSLPDQDDVPFTVDATSGTVRTSRYLDYEERQVYGVTVRATDGGQPALFSEATLIVEVLDVDENMHAPQFTDSVLAGSVKENSVRGAPVLSVPAKDADAQGRDSKLTYYVIGGDGMGYFSIDDAGMIRTLAPLDRETTPHYWLTVCAEDHGLIPKHSCVEVYIEVEDVNDMVPWPEYPMYNVSIQEHSPAGTMVAKIVAYDGDATIAPVKLSYRIVAGNPDGLFSIDERTGVIVTTGRTLDREATSMHALEVRISDGELASTTRVQITLLDINDHTPEFTQRFYQLRVPIGAATNVMPQNDAAALDIREGSGFEASAEGETDEDDDSSGKQPWDMYDDDDTISQGIYVGSVLALDADSGTNGSVRYSSRARGSARGLIVVHAKTGKIYATAPMRKGAVYDLTIRACDQGTPPRCGWSRVSLRGVAAGGGSPPSLPAPPAPTAAELDAPGFLLALLQANDPELDTVYYSIVDGDPRNEFLIGREDGSLVLARRLLWERQNKYSLNVSVTDGTNVVYTLINVTVVNDINEGGLSFTQDQYEVEVNEETRVGEALLALRAVPESGEAKVLYGLLAAKAPASLPLFRLDEVTGVLELAQSLDRETSSRHELTVWARDNAPKSSRAFARVLVTVHDRDEHAPDWGRRLAEARVPFTAPPGTVVATLRATDRDFGENAKVVYSLAGGDAAGIFTIDATTGVVSLSRRPPAAPREYTLQVRAGPTSLRSTLPLHVLFVDHERAPPVFTESSIVCEVYENSPAGTLLTTLEAKSSSTVRYDLEGGNGLFRVNPSIGAVSTAAPLDYETQNLYNITIVASNMGGGTAEAKITVHVLDRNEYPPKLTSKEYHGKVSESASIGDLVTKNETTMPLVLEAEDEDSPANQQRRYELLDPIAALAFRVDPTTGALVLRAKLDYETQSKYEFGVKVLDMGTPRLRSESVARVFIDVEDVDDCSPIFAESTYQANIILPTAKGVLVTKLQAKDADTDPSKITYDIVEGDNDVVFKMNADGVLFVEKSDDLESEYRLKVRASDGLHSTTAKVYVQVIAPEPTGLAFQKMEYFGAVIENSTKPTTIVVLNILGAALNEHVEFSILNPVEGFKIGLTSGVVSSTGVPLDRERRASYRLGVSARAGGRLAATVINIAVTDVNDNCPVFVEKPYDAAVRAGDPPGTHVIRVKAIDIDENDNGEVRYEMKRGHGELFKVDRKSGLITLKQTIDAHNQLYELVIAAFDGGVPACGSEAHVTVRVWGGGTAPSWEKPHYTITVKEDLPIGAPLGAPLRAISPLQRQLVYTLLEPDKTPEIELHFDTAHDRGNSPCVLIVAAPLDRETHATLSLVVRAVDGVTAAAADATVTVILSDANDCAPTWPRDQYSARVSEAAAVGLIVLVVKAADNDTGLNGEVVYSLTGSWEGPAPLLIEPTTGIIRIATPLDREKTPEIRAIITASDKGQPPLFTTTHLIVTVEDVNDSPPKMERNVIPVTVSREAARGTPLAALVAWDPDSNDAGNLKYALASHDPHHTFAVNPRTGLLTLANTRAWANSASNSHPLSLNVSVSDGAHAAFARVKLTPAPANLHPPHFQHLLHEARALENQPAPFLLTTVKAFDDDFGEYGTITYSIPSQLLRETFAIDSSTGALTTKTALDREAKSEWLIPIMASDGGGLLKHTAVRVKVADLNDNSPTFPHKEYRAAVRNDRVPRNPFLTVSAFDIDDGDNAKLTYSLYDRNDGPSVDTRGLFHVDPVTGALSFARNATQFGSRLIEVWVRATDGGGKAGETPVAIYILGADEKAPVVNSPPADLFLPEDAPPGTLIADLGGPESESVKYRLAGGQWSRDQFAIDDSGRLVLAATLDRETSPSHRIAVITSSKANPSIATMSQVTLHALDANEHAPVFHSQPYVIYLAENSPLHSSVVQVIAEDPDSGSNGEVRYSLAEENNGAPFTLDAYTGWLVVAGPLDRETVPEHRLAVLATDNGGSRRVARGTVVIRLKDYNDCPPKFAMDQYTAAVREDAAPGTIALKLEVDDPDIASSPLAFYVADGDPYARFQLRSTGELIVARSLDRETVPTHDLLVLATDGKFSATAQVHIDVLDANDNPPYCLKHRYYAQLSEDAIIGTHVATVEASDADEPQNARLRFYITGDGAEHFAVQKDLGRVTVASVLDRETKAFYRLSVHAQDRDRPEWECQSELQITIDDVNDNDPRFSALRYSVTLPEDAELGTLVAKVHATDADLGQNRLLKYSLVDEDSGGAFELSPDSGIITLRAPLDRETASSHRLVIHAQDSGTPSRSATALVHLTVADVNDNPPEFEFRIYSASVPELDAVGTEILRVAATSKDTGVNAEVHYSIVAGDQRADFAIDRDSGAISIARPLDYERIREYTLTIQAIDGGSPPLSDHATVNISIVDCNDNPPMFSQASYGARVREDAKVGTKVLQVVAMDADSNLNGRVHYSLSRGDRAGQFLVDSDTGYVSLAAPLDRETTPAYVLEIRAKDSGIPSLETTTTVNIEVLDANDNPPLFTQNNYSCVVQEGRPLGHPLLELKVTDIDAPPNGAPFTFDFQSGNEMGAFRLEQDGYLRTATRFNHRIKERYVLQIRVFDNGTPPLYSDAWVYVRVIEESQYPPVVTPLEIVVNSYLDEFPGGELGGVVASDRDAYDTLEWSIATTDNALYPLTELFSIDSKTGILKAVPRLDVGEYRLNVTVSDGRFVSSALVRITVLLITEETLSHAVVVRFRAVSDVDFVLSHRKGFIRAVAEAMEKAPSDVLLLSVQPSSSDRTKRQVAQDLDVLFAVRNNGESLLPADTLRRRLHAHIERLEERTRLVVEELVRAACGGCLKGNCTEKAELFTSETRAVAADVFSLVSPTHKLNAACVCKPGWGGIRCDTELPDQASTPAVAHFSGEGYALYRLEKGVINGERLLEDELMITIKFRTLSPRGTLLWAAGKVDYLVMEIVEGFVQVRMELGEGEAIARAAVEVADGAWHVVRLERRGGSMKLHVDRHSAHAHTPPDAAVLDTADDHLYVGASMIRHAHANAPLQVTYGFVGCISELKLSGTELPLQEGSGTSGIRVRAQLIRAVRIKLVSRCPNLPPPSACSSYPCLNGGTCRETIGLISENEAEPNALFESDSGYTCTCLPRYTGASCETDTSPCASRPCLHGGVCSAAGDGYSCQCAPPTSGPRCERGKYCTHLHVCNHGGSCEEGSFGASCRCRGYYGPLCQLDVDECAGEPCADGATCVNEPGSFRCVCPPGRTGTHCGNPLHSGAVRAADASGTSEAIWLWVYTVKWPLYAAGSLALLLLILLTLLPLLCRKKRRNPTPVTTPIPNHKKPQKLSNLARSRPTSGTEQPPMPLNNADTLRSYGSAGDELEGIPPEYIRNLNLETDRKPWSEQMHLHTFTDNKIYNDLKGTISKGAPSPPAPCRVRRIGGPGIPGVPMGPGIPGVPLGPGGDGQLVGGYHWDCSDWCGGNGALPAITEVTCGERRDSTSPPSSLPSRRNQVSRPCDSSGLDDEDKYDFADASSYLVHPDEYLPPMDGTLRALRLREPDSASLMTMLEERNSLLRGDERDDTSLGSANLCEIEESDTDSVTRVCKHTDV